MPSAFNVGRFREHRVCGCSSRNDGPGTCSHCGLLLPRDLSALSHAERLALLESIPYGAALTLFGHEFVLSPVHARPSEVSQWRSRVDSLADAALGALKGGDSADAADVLEAAADGGCGASAALLESATLPSWVDAARVQRGGRLWFLFLPVLGPSLLNLSLLGGYGASAINAVLIASGGLAGARDTVHRRIFRTLQFVNDVAGIGALERGGRGWRSCLNIRLLHARVRAHIHKGSSGGTSAQCPLGLAWDESALGAPVSGGDIVATQLAFSLVMLMGAERVGLLSAMSDDDVSDILHWWGAVGALLGAPSDTPRLNAWARTGDVRGAQCTLESLVAVLAAPGPATRPLVLAGVRSVAWRLPFYWSPADHVAVSAALAGAPYAAALGLPSLDDPVLVERINDPSPTTAFLAECAHTHCTALHLTVDAQANMSVRRRLLRLLLRGVFTIVRIVGAVCGSSMTVALGDTPAVTHGRALLAPLRWWSTLVSLLPDAARRGLAARAEAGLVGLVATRLRGRAIYTFGMQSAFTLALVLYYYFALLHAPLLITAA